MSRESGLDHGRRPVSHLYTEVQSEEVQPPDDASPVPVRLLSKERTDPHSLAAVGASARGDAAHIVILASVEARRGPPGPRS